MIQLYIGVLAGLLLLLFLSRRERPVSDRQVTGILIPIRKAAVWLYRVSQKFLRKGSPGRGVVFPGSHAVMNDLALLDASKGNERKAALYYIDKFQNFLLFVFAADLLAMAVWYSESQEQVISQEGIVARPDYGESDLALSVQATDGGEDGISYGEYSINIEARQYTQEEAQELADQLFEILPETILGSNESLDHVITDLNLITSLNGYPFSISWKSSRYEWIGADGSVNTESIEEGEYESVTLTATIRYEDWSWEQSYEILVYPETLSQEEQLVQSIQEALSASNDATVSEEDYYLPDEVSGVSLQWEEVTEDTSTPLFLLVLAAGAAVFALGDRDLHQKVQKREQQLLLDYPQIVSKLALFLGAGMSVRNAFVRLGNNYLKEQGKGGEKRYVYEEILLVCREMDSGISESTALSHFGSRCHTRQYTKLSSLLVQNLKKGNAALLQVLQEEAELAFEERKNLARQMGEEAGTRLLLPMILMLGVTLVIIMIPAFMSFT